MLYQAAVFDPLCCDTIILDLISQALCENFGDLKVLVEASKTLLLYSHLSGSLLLLLDYLSVFFHDVGVLHGGRREFFQLLAYVFASGLIDGPYPRLLFNSEIMLFIPLRSSHTTLRLERVFLVRLAQLLKADISGGANLLEEKF